MHIRITWTRAHHDRRAMATHQRPHASRRYGQGRAVAGDSAMSMTRRYDQRQSRLEESHDCTVQSWQGGQQQGALLVRHLWTVSPRTPAMTDLPPPPFSRIPLKN